MIQYLEVTYSDLKRIAQALGLRLFYRDAPDCYWVMCFDFPSGLFFTSKILKFQHTQDLSDFLSSVKDLATRVDGVSNVISDVIEDVVTQGVTRPLNFNLVSVLGSIDENTGRIVPLKSSNGSLSTTARLEFSGEVDIGEVVIKGILSDGTEVRLAAAPIGSQNVLRVLAEPVSIKNESGQIISPATENTLVSISNSLSRLRFDDENLKVADLVVRGLLSNLKFDVESNLRVSDLAVRERLERFQFDESGNLRVFDVIQETRVKDVENQFLDITSDGEAKTQVSSRVRKLVSIYPGNQVQLGPNTAGQYIYPSYPIDSSKFMVKTFYLKPSARNKIRFRVEESFDGGETWVPITENFTLGSVDYFTRFTTTDAVGLIRLNAAPVDDGTYTLNAYFGGQT